MLLHMLAIGMIILLKILVHNASQQIKIQKRALLFPLSKLCINAPKFIETFPTSLSGIE